MNLNERITLEEGLRMYTINAQKMIKNDHGKGLYQEGYLADIVVFDGNIFHVLIRQLPICKSVAAIVNV